VTSQNVVTAKGDHSPRKATTCKTVEMEDKNMSRKSVGCWNEMEHSGKSTSFIAFSWTHKKSQGFTLGQDPRIENGTFWNIMEYSYSSICVCVSQTQKSKKEYL
jgi:hypothetical protein